MSRVDKSPPPYQVNHKGTGQIHPRCTKAADTTHRNNQEQTPFNKSAVISVLALAILTTLVHYTRERL